MKHPLRIATLNFLAGGSARRFAHWSMLREELAPDLILTQESRPPPDSAGPFATALWTRTSRGWGTGLYAPRLKLLPVTLDGFEGWVTGGELAGWPGPRASKAGPPTGRRGQARPTRIFSVHCPAGKRGYLHTVHEMLDGFQAMSAKADLILGGDFNVAVGMRPLDDLRLMSKAERALLTRFTDDLGLVPAWQTANPGQPLAQTLRWSGNRATPYHCDGIFIPRAWKRRLVSCAVLAGPGWERLSDHNPVLAVLRHRGI